MVTSQREYVEVGVQGGTVPGGADPTNWTPVGVEPGTFSAESGYETLLDRGRRSLDAMDFGSYKGVGMASISFTENVRIATATAHTKRSAFGIFMANLLNDPDSHALDTNTNAAGHLLRMGNNIKYLTIRHFIPGTANPVWHVYEDCRVSEMTISANAAEGLVTYSVTLTGQDRLSGAAGAPFTTGRPTSIAATARVLSPPIEGWAMGVNGPATMTDSLISCEWTLRRDSEPFYAGRNQRKYQDLYLGPLEVTCATVLDFQDDADLTVYRNSIANQGVFATWFSAEALVAGDFTGTLANNHFGLMIGGALFDYGDEKVAVDTSNINARIAIACRGLASDALLPDLVVGGGDGFGATTTQAGSPIIVAVYEHKGALPARFTTA